MTKIIRWSEPLCGPLALLMLFYSGLLPADEQQEAAPAAEEEIVMPKASVIDLNALTDMDRLLAKVVDKQLVYVSESHDRYDHHLNQLAVVKGMYEKHKDLVIGLEFFQQPFQPALDRYISGEIDETAFVEESEYLDRWRFDYRLYRPIFRFAQANGIPMIALNVPREITEKVADAGIEGLSEEEKQQIPQEIDRDNERYREKLEEVFKQHPHFEQRIFDHFLEAQLLWDEGMAERAAQHFKENPEGHMVLLAGTGHLAYRMGIPDRLERRTPVSSALIINGLSGGVDKEMGDYLVNTAPERIERHGLIGVFLDTDEGAPRITEFSKDSDAEMAGLKLEDRIVGIAGKPVKSYADLKMVLMDMKPKEDVEITVKRKSLFFGEQTRDYTVTLK